MTDPTSLSMLRLLAASPHISQREVASSVGVSLGKANYCLRALITKGFVKAEDYRNSSNKLAHLYLLTPEGVVAKADLTRQFLAHKVREFEALRLEIQRLERESRVATEGDQSTARACREDGVGCVVRRTARRL